MTWCGWLRYCGRQKHESSLVRKAELVQNMRIPKNSEVTRAESKNVFFSLGVFCEGSLWLRVMRDRVRRNWIQALYSNDKMVNHGRVDGEQILKLWRRFSNLPTYLPTVLPQAQSGMKETPGRVPKPI